MADPNSSSSSESCFLIEFVSSARTRPADVWARVEALEATGTRVEAAVVFAGEIDAAVCGHPLPERLRRLDRSRWPHAIRELSRGRPYATLVVAGEAAAAVAREARSHWGREPRLWPTVLGTDASLNELALRCAVASRPRAPRTRVALWDGDYLLAPAALAGHAGQAWIEAFAQLAHQHDMIDLVILAEPQPELQRLARKRGVALRIHWVGASPLRAECLWMACASALLVGGAVPDPSATLRALESAVPILVAGEDAATRSLADWLSRHGAMGATMRPGRAPLLQVLMTALARTPEVRVAASRGAALAADHRPERLAATLRRSVHGGSPEAGRRAA